MRSTHTKIDVLGLIGAAAVILVTVVGTAIDQVRQHPHSSCAHQAASSHRQRWSCRAGSSDKCREFVHDVDLCGQASARAAHQQYTLS